LWDDNVCQVHGTAEEVITILQIEVTARSCIYVCVVCVCDCVCVCVCDVCEGGGSVSGVATW